MKKKIFVYLMVLVISMFSFSGCKTTTVVFESDISSMPEGVLGSDYQDNSSDVSQSEVQSGGSSTGGQNVTSPVQTSNSSEVVEASDKSSDHNQAYASETIASNFDAQAAKIRNAVLSAGDSVSVSGKKWYISNKGSDSNGGTSPSDAWATSAALKQYKDNIKSGDAVLFERGGVYRGKFETKSGVYYGAYGNGDKPCIYGSVKAGDGKWTNKGGNIWCYESETFTEDTGGIFFDHGKAIGNKKASVDELQAEYDFALQGGRVYLYMSKNPTEAYKSIEIAVNGHLISVPGTASDVIIDNLTIKYCGGHGIRTNNGSKNVTVKNCEIAYIGGSYLSSDGTRYGNGIEMWQGIENMTIKNCWIYQIYDSGVTHQGPDAYKVKNVLVSGCLIEYCGFGSIEYWHNQGAYNSIENVEYSDNVMRFAGFGWGAGRQGIGYHIHSNGATNDNKATNFVIKNNIFDLAPRMLFDIRGGAGTMPTLSGNTYSQYDGRFLGCYGDIINQC